MTKAYLQTHTHNHRWDKAVRTLLLIHLDLRYRYGIYLIGILLLVGLYVMQKYRVKSETLKESV